MIVYSLIAFIHILILVPLALETETRIMDHRSQASDMFLHKIVLGINHF